LGPIGADLIDWGRFSDLRIIFYTIFTGILDLEGLVAAFLRSSGGLLVVFWWSSGGLLEG